MAGDQFLYLMIIGMRGLCMMRLVVCVQALEPHLHDDVALHIVEPRATSPAVVQHAIRALTGPAHIGTAQIL